jgi:hypothetical protein
MSNTFFALLVIGVVFLCFFAFALYFRHPRFSGISPKDIEVVAYRPFSDEITYRMDIRERASCEKVLKELSQAQFSVFGFRPTGVLNIRYDNGTEDHVKFTQCNDGTHSLEFHMFYVIPSQQFCQVLKEAGVDVSKLAGHAT